MFKIIRTGQSFLRSARNYEKVLSRTLLSESFESKEAWNRRLESPILKKVKTEDFYYELENKFQQSGQISAIDVDIFANSLRDDSHLDEIEDVIHKFRLTGEATKILPSTHHAFIRTFLSYGNLEELIRILNDRLNYGIFPDDFCSILMMGKFIKSEKYKEAAKIAVLHMLQEDFSNPVTLYLSLYSCHKYLLSPMEWEKPEVTESSNDDEEEIRVRVKYIRNPYFDNHFDLRDPDQLIGKTLSMSGALVKDSVGRMYEIIGYGLQKNWPIVKNLLESAMQKDQSLYKDGIHILKEIHVKVLSKMEGESEEKNELLQIGILIENFKFFENQELLMVTEQRLKKLISENEEELVKTQAEIYDSWDSQRELLLKEELEEVKRQSRLKEVEKKKEELSRKEEELFFFDREDELDLKIESKKVRYPKKWLGKKKKKLVQGVEYIPPEITKSLG